MRQDDEMAIVISIGKWGGIYWYQGFGVRLCLGWIAFTILPVDGDDLLDAASRRLDARNNQD